MSGLWWLVSASSFPRDGERLHTCIEGRYVTVFRHKGRLSCIDSICHHAGGPLTLGNVIDIEDIGKSVVSCPWHKFLVSIDDGIKAYKGVDIIGGVPTPTGWKTGKVVQRSHAVVEKGQNVFVRLHIPEEEGWTCASDNDASSELCAQAFEMHHEVPQLYDGDPSMM